MRRLTALALIGLLVAIGCGLGRLVSVDGGACNTDGNCPSSQVCCDGTCRVVCSQQHGDEDLNGPASVVTVLLLTDFAAASEFDSVRSRIDATTIIDTPIKVAMHFDKPRHVTTFVAVPRGDHTVNVALMLAGAKVIEQLLPVHVAADVTVTASMPRHVAACSSAGTCPLNTADCAVPVCAAGQCFDQAVPEDCTPGSRCRLGVGCVPVAAECLADLDCDDHIACTRDVCGAGVCVNVPDHSLCDDTVCAPYDDAANAETGCAPSPCGPDNCVPAPCGTASCIQGECVRGTLCVAGETCCNGLCGTQCSDPLPCANRVAGAICRAAAGACDITEVCDGVSQHCPPDVVQAASTACRAARGGCDLDDVCDGVHAACATDTVVPASSVCRAATLPCDVTETCNGKSPFCPVDLAMTMGTQCRPVATTCDVPEACNGAAKDCPVDGFKPLGTVCRAAVGPCDAVEMCTGVLACPADTMAANTVVCRQAVDLCDNPEKCTGTAAACPPDTMRPASFVCRAAATGCDAPESCTGTSNVCPADGLRPNGYVCRGAADGCDVPESCNGVSSACPANVFNTGVCCSIDGYTGACIQSCCSNGVCGC